MASAKAVMAATAVMATAMAGVVVKAAPTDAQTVAVRALRDGRMDAQTATVVVAVAAVAAVAAAAVVVAAKVKAMLNANVLMQPALHP
jgi:CHASE2 domain-containing sensor protein